MKRRSLSNPPERGENRRTTQLLKLRGSSADGGSHIPRPRIRSLSTDRLSGRKSTLLKQPSKVSLGHHAVGTPKAPSYPRSTLLSMSQSRNARSPSAERASFLMQTKGPRKDTRPISDKAFQTQMLRKIDNYFHSIQKSSMLNANGSLKPLSIKMFVEMSDLLVKEFGIKQALNNINYIEEMPHIAKKLFYPGQMSKAWLKTANAMHALPNALAWLSWLVEMCELKDFAVGHFSLQNLPFTNVNDQAERNQNLFLSMIEWYGAWQENAELEETLVAEYLQREEIRYDVGADKLTSARRENEKKLRELEKEDKLRADVDLERKKLEAILASLEQDEKNIDDYIFQQEEHIQKLTARNERIKSDCRVLDMDIEKDLELQEELKITIANQPISPAERDEIVVKCNEMRKFLKEFSSHLEDIQKDIYSRDMKLSSANHNLTKIVLQYNREVHNHFFGISDDDIAEIKMPESILNPQSMDALKSVSAALTKLKEKKNRELEEVEKLVQDNQAELENLQEQMKVLNENKEELARKSKKRQEEINQIKAQAKVDEAELRENVKKLQKKLTSLQESRLDVASLRKDLEERIDKCDSLKRRKEYLEKRACIFFDNFHSILAEQRKERANICKLNK